MRSKEEESFIVERISGSGFIQGNQSTTNPNDEETMDLSPRKVQAAKLSIFSNITLTILKVLVGIITGSIGILAEGLHSLFDLFAAIVTWFSVRISGQPPDLDHPFGHRKFESMASLIETGLLFITSAWIALEAFNRLIDTGEHVVRVEIYSYGVMGLSVLLNIFVSRYLYSVAEETQSDALKADALHLSSDVLGSIAVLIGLVGVSLGYSILDPVAALVVSGIIVRAGAELWAESSSILLDKAPPIETSDLIFKKITGVDGVEDVHDLRIRKVGDRLFIDVHVHVKPNLSIAAAHTIADIVEDRIQETFPISDIVVHLEPKVHLKEEEDIHQNLIRRVEHAALTINGVTGVHKTRIHRIAGRLRSMSDSTKESSNKGTMDIEMHVQLQKEISLDDAHEKAEEVEISIRERVPEISSVTTHLEPSYELEDARYAMETDVRKKIWQIIETLKKHYPEILSLEIRSIVESSDGVNVALKCVLPQGESLGSSHNQAHIIEDRVKAFLDPRKGRVRVTVHMEPYSKNKA